jgi:hypothetical protein
LVLSVFNDGTTRILSGASGDEIARYISFNDTSWIVITPDGFFNTSGPEVAKHINVVHENDPLSLDSFYDTLYRPDLVQEALAGDPDGKVAEAAKTTNLDTLITSGQPPQITSLKESEKVKSSEVKLKLEIAPRDGGIGKVEWRVNGVVQSAQERGLASIRDEDNSDYVVEKTLQLSPGKNIVNVIAYNKANLIASDPIQLVVEVSAGAISKPNLFVLSVAVDDYYDSKLALNYTNSDARAIGQAFQKSSVELFEKIEVSYLLNEDVSAAKMADTFQEIGSKMSPQDVFVFFLAGHGKTFVNRILKRVHIAV